MPFFDSMNDDQVALLGCAVALFLCGGGMVLSYTLRRWITGVSRQAAEQRHAAEPFDSDVALPESDQRRAA